MRTSINRVSWPLIAAVLAIGCGDDAPAESDTGPGAVDAAVEDADPCPPGSEDCACRDEGESCEPGLRCALGRCESCDPGTEGCACRGDLGCDAELSCEEGVCAPCPPGAAGCSCDREETCEGSLVCEADRCAPIGTCPVLRAAGLCPEGRVCEMVAGAPSCLDMCEAGFERDAFGGCVRCAAGSCATRTCAAESMGSECAALAQVCIEDAGGARCGDCIDGWVVDPPSGRCVPAASCGGSMCAPGDVAIREADGSCRCDSRPCPLGEALGPAGVCVSCGAFSCGGSGETGAIFPRTDASGACMCETTASHYWPRGDLARAQPCDADGDGWIRDTALAAIDSGDPALAANARCDVLRAGRVRLVNEMGQAHVVASCAGGLASGDTEASCAGMAEPIVLVESERNDVAQRLEESARAVPPTTPPYESGDLGRALGPAELNALTRACVSPEADFDDDGTPDVAEGHPSGLLARTNAERLAAFTFFVELHTVSFERGAIAGADGTLVIRERPRCEPGFPLTELDGAGSYALDCHRTRDARFDRRTGAPGFDFAQWTCDEERGSCPFVELPSSATLTDHGACLPDLYRDEPWRGFAHHAQYQCVRVADSRPAGSASAYTAAARDFDPSGWLDFWSCWAESGAGAFACEPRPAASGRVGWASTRYAPRVELETEDGTRAVDEVRGCVDETLLGDRLCTPGPTTLPHDDESDFGRLDCTCDPSELVTFYADSDRDGFGASSVTMRSCADLDAGPSPEWVRNGDDCDDTSPDVMPGGRDERDSAGRDENCDGFDGIVNETVYVARRGVDTAPGTPAEPVRTIGRGIELAASRGATAVVVDGGEYPERVRLVSGISLLGGYESSGWRPSASATTILVAHPHSAVVDARTLVGIEAVEIVASTTLADVRIEQRVTAPTTYSVHGLRVVDSPALAVRSVRITLGRAGAGEPGPRGVDGPDGGDGIRGQPGRGASAGLGGVGGAGGCPGTDGYGGGAGAVRSSGVYSGSDGFEPVTGFECGGDGAFFLQSACVLGGDDGTGDAGSSCSSPSRGDDGAPATRALEHGLWSDDAFWFPAPGITGAPGLNGAPGGGGGGGLASMCGTCPTVAIFGDLGGGGGGGGGAAGCGGAGGAGGGGGGAALGVVAIRSAGLTLTGVQIAGGIGGAGAVGGAGGTGGTGGSGGAGGDGGLDADGDVCGTDGGGGGRAGAGGNGGRGGGGPGGMAYAIAYCDGRPALETTSLFAFTGGRGDATYTPALDGTGGTEWAFACP